MSTEPFTFPRSAEPLVSFVVPTMRRADTLPTTVAALAREASGDIACELVIVLDKPATPEVHTMVMQFKGVEVVTPGVRVGVPGGLALGCAAASGSVCFVIHDDATLGPGSLSELLAILDSRPEAGIVGPATEVAGGSVGSVVWQDGRTSHVPDHLAPSRPFAVDAVGTRALMIRTSTLAAVEGFDCRFFPAGYVDVDICTQVRAAGEAVLAVPSATVSHHPESTSSPEMRSLQAWRNHRRYVDKWRAELDGHVPLDLHNLDAGITRALARSRREAGANAARPRRPARRRELLDRSALEQRCLEEAAAFRRDQEERSWESG